MQLDIVFDIGINMITNTTSPVADPGFPIGGGGCRPHRGGTNSPGGYVLKNLYVKTKESGLVGGARAGGAPLDLPLKSI